MALKQGDLALLEHAVAKELARVTPDMRSTPKE